MPSPKERRKPRVVFVEQFYWPEGWGGAQLPRDVTVHLARNGYDVEVVCGSDTYAPVEGDPGASPAESGVRIRRLPRLIGGDIHRAKLLRQLWFYLAALPALLLRRRPALFVTQTNPPLVVLLVALAALVHRRPFAIVAMDLYPEVLVAHGSLGAGSPLATLLLKILARVFGWAYRRAALVVSLGPVMTRRLEAKGVPRDRIVEISNWATGEEHVVRGPENRLRAAWGLEGCFVVLYSGNLGIAHDVETPIHALREAHLQEPRVRLVFVGKGSRLEEARRVAREAGVEHLVQFRALVPLEMLPHSLGLADCALVTLREGFDGLVVPSKLLGYMARGVPTLYVGPASDAQQLVEGSGGGACVANGDEMGLASWIVRLARDAGQLAAMGEGAEDYYAEHLDREVGLARYLDVVDSLAQAAVPEVRA